MKIWMDGELLPEEKAKISVKTHSLHYGTAVFEGIRFYDTKKGIKIFRLDDHIERLFRSAENFNMDVPFSRDDIKCAVKGVINNNDLKEGYIRPIIFYGDESIGAYPGNVSVHAAVFATPWNLMKDGLRVKTANIRKINRDATVPGVKITGTYFNSVLAMEEARKLGFDEPLILDEVGYVSEGPTQTFFIVKDNLITTSISKSQLPGITRDTILKIAKDLGYESIEKELTVEEARDADEAFFCATAYGIVYIKELDYIKICQEIGQVTKNIKQKYDEIVHGKDDKYERWLEDIE